MCGEEEETTRHLFFYCRVVWLVWTHCHVDFISHFLHFKLCNVPAYVNVFWERVWVTLISEIWRHRNKHIFKGEVIDHSEIFSLIQLKVWSWKTSKFVSSCFSFSDWCLNPVTCLFLIKSFY